MKRLQVFMSVMVFILAIQAFAQDSKQMLADAEKLAAEESVRKLEASADSITNDSEQFRQLRKAVGSLKDADRAKALVGKIRNPGYRDFTMLETLARFKQYDDAITLMKGKDIEAWPTECRGAAYKVLGDIHQAQKNDAAALDNYILAIAAPATEVIVRGWAAHAAGGIYLKQRDRVKAEAMFRQALGISPAGWAWRNECMTILSGMLIEDKRAPEAVKLFESLDFEKMDIPYWKAVLLEAYAHALLADGKKIKAAEMFDALLKTDISKEQKAKIEKELDKLAEGM